MASETTVQKPDVDRPKGNPPEAASPKVSPPEVDPAEAAGPEADSPEAPASRIRRVRTWIAAHRLKTAIFAALGLVLVGGGVTACLLAMPRHEEEAPAVTAAMVLEALDRGNDAEAKRLAETFRDQAPPADEEATVAALALGVVAAREAEKQTEAEKRKLFLVAAAYLKDARTRGFPPGRKAEGTYLLGKSLVGSGQIAASRQVLREVLELDKQLTPEVHYLLAAGYLRDPAGKYSEALQENDLCLADSRLSASRRAGGLLQRAEIQLNLGKLAECRQTLAKIPPGTTAHHEAIVLQGRILIREAQALQRGTDDADRKSKAGQKYQEALQTLRRAQDQERLSDPAVPKAMYLIGVCLVETGDSRGALNQFARMRTICPDTVEAAAADFQEAELWRQLQRDKEALAAYRRAMKPLPGSDAYENPWLPAELVRRRIVDAYQHYLDARNYAVSLELARLLGAVFSKDRAVQTEAETYRVWGHELVAQAERLGPPRAEPIAREGRAHLRQAGAAYERLARLRLTTRHYPNDLWDSSDAYLAGHDFRGAARMFRAYLKHESRLRQAPAMTGLGASLLAMGRVDESVAVFQKVIAAYPRDVSSYRARVLAARARIEKGDVHQAESLLEENLNGESLTPASKEWRESLFLLGELLHATGRYTDAIRRLEEAVERYGDSRQALAARYLIADSYHRKARAEAEKLQQDLVEEARIDRARQVRDLLASALKRYQQAQESLRRYQDAHDPGPLEKAMLRNGEFAVGSVMLDLGQYESALKTFASVTSRHQNAPEALEAYVQMARLHRRLQRPADARATLDQAKLVLNRMKPEVAYRDTTNYSRKEWAELLDRLAK